MADEKEKKVATAKKEENKEKAVKTEKAATKVAEKNNVEPKKTVEKKQEVKTAEKKESKEAKATKIEKKSEENSNEMTAKDTLNLARISSRKIAIVAHLIRGKNVEEALAILKFTPKAGSKFLEKLLNSAIANAENNNQMNRSKLYIAEIYSNQGPTMKRIRPAAKGSAARIRKRTSNTTIVLKERD